MKKLLTMLFIIIGLTAQDKQFTTAVINSADSNVIVNLGKKVGGSDYRFVMFITDTAMTSDTVTFQVYDEKRSSYVDFYTIANAKVSYTIGASRAYQVDPDAWYGVRKFKMVFDAAEAASRNITIVKE